MKQSKIENIVKQIVDVLKDCNANKIVLFGSRARGDCRINSDIDIAVDLELSFRDERKLREKIEEISGLYSVDLIFFSKIDVNFKNQILKEGIVLYEKK